MAGQDKLSDFISYVKTKGLAKTSHFGVFFTPIGSGTSSNSNINSLLLLCSQANLPGINIATTPGRIYGETFEFGYEKNYSQVTMNFYVDSKFEVKKLFDSWAKEIYDPKTRTWGFYKDYTTTVDIFAHNMEHKVVYKVTLHEAYPKTIQDIQLDYMGTGLMNLQVTFAYKYFEVEDSYQQISSDKPGNAGVKPDSLKGVLSDDVSVLDSYVKDFNAWQNNLISNVSKQYNSAKNSVAKSAKEAINSFLKK